MSLVPLEVMTVTSTVPATRAGAIAVICVAESTVKEDALVVPNFTAVTPVNPVPLIVTEVPPAVGPTLGLTAVTVSALHSHVSPREASSMPPNRIIWLAAES